MQEELAQVAHLLVEADLAVALTGAGLSIDSGIPAFRGSQGLWERFDPMEYASIEAFRADPVKVWGMLRELDALVLAARPNPAHLALARLEELGRLAAVVTQNIDGLHQQAGSREVIEFHGSGRHLRCLDCGRRLERETVDLEARPPRCPCGGLIKPDVIFFGEAIPERALMRAFALASACRVMLVAGTSAMVAPASHLPVMAKRAGAAIVEINPEPSPLMSDIVDFVFPQGAGRVLSQLARLVEEELAGREQEA